MKRSIGNVNLEDYSEVNPLTERPKAPDQQIEEPKLHGDTRALKSRYILFALLFVFTGGVAGTLLVYVHKTQTATPMFFLDRGPASCISLNATMTEHSNQGQRS